MDLIFDVGEREAPKGHALVYFRDRANPEKYLVTYVVVLPVAIDPSRYVPQAFAGKVPSGLATVDATALPPIPEPVEDLGQLRTVAQHRGDDVIDGGTVDADEAERLVYMVHEMTQAYEKLYRAAADQWAAEPASEPDGETVKLLLMSELGRLEELARVTGQLRYAVDGQDTRLAEETATSVERIVGLLPEKYNLQEYSTLIQAPSEHSRRLAALLLERSFKLCNEEYEALAALDEQIDAERRLHEQES
ncbi:MAG: hypothetical protein CL878_10390 [Dehalococcoidia bacterium]|nr:hypothetical protein [Dehalococcoidia bacterium]